VTIIAVFILHLTTLEHRFVSGWPITHRIYHSGVKSTKYVNIGSSMAGLFRIAARMTTTYKAAAAGPASACLGTAMATIIRRFSSSSRCRALHCLGSWGALLQYTRATKSQCHLLVYRTKLLSTAQMVQRQEYNLHLRNKSNKFSLDDSECCMDAHAAESDRKRIKRPLKYSLVEHRSRNEVSVLREIACFNYTFQTHLYII